MGTNATLKLPLSTCKNVAMEIIGNLPPDEFCDVAEQIEEPPQQNCEDSSLGKVARTIFDTFANHEAELR